MAEISSTTGIKVWQDDAIGHMQFDRPKSKNAISQEMWSAIPAIINHFDQKTEIRAIVISGSGDDSFSAGADITEFSENRTDRNKAQHYEQLNVNAFRAIATAKKPTIAKVKGFCMGGGLAVALSCDLRFAADNAVFSLPPAKLGLAYPVIGIRQLLSVVSPPVAKELIFAARRFKALDASRCGLVNQVTSLGQLDELVADLCKSIVNNAPLTIAASKQTIDELHNNPVNPDWKKLQALSSKCFDSHDYREGQIAFKEKRRPEFKGN